MTLVLLAIIAYPFCYPAGRALDRWIMRIERRIENDVEIRRRAAMHEQAIAPYAGQQMSRGQFEANLGHKSAAGKQ